MKNFATNHYLILADDDEDDRILFLDILKGLPINFNLIATENGKKLMNILETMAKIPPPHFIFLDINLPFLNGIECLTKIRAERRFDSIPVFMFSTSANLSDVRKSFQLGANRYINKSFWFSSPMRAIEQILLTPPQAYLEPVTIDEFVITETKKSIGYF